MNINATILGQAIAFVLFVWFCMKYVWPPLIRTIEKRQKEIADGLASGERALKEALLAQENTVQITEQAKAKAFAIIEQANKQKMQILEEAKQEAEAEKAKILKKGLTELNAERKRTQDELRKQIAMLVMTGAEKVIRRSVNEAENSDIIDKLTAEL